MYVCRQIVIYNLLETENKIKYKENDSEYILVSIAKIKELLVAVSCKIYRSSINIVDKSRFVDIINNKNININ